MSLKNAIESISNVKRVPNVKRKSIKYFATFSVIIMLLVVFNSMVQPASAEVPEQYIIVTGEKTIEDLSNESAYIVKNGNEYDVDAFITVADGGILYIEDSILQFNTVSDDSLRGIIVSSGGRLEAFNSRFTALNSFSPDSWQGIEFDTPTSSGIVQNCIVEYAETGIYSASSLVEIVDNTITNSTSGIAVQDIYGVPERRGVALVVTQPEVHLVYPDSVVDYQVTIINTGTVTDTFNVTPTSGNIIESTVTLGPGESKELLLSLLAPSTYSTSFEVYIVANTSDGIEDYGSVKLYTKSAPAPTPPKRIIKLPLPLPPNRPPIIPPDLIILNSQVTTVGVIDPGRPRPPIDCINSIINPRPHVTSAYNSEDTIYQLYPVDITNPFDYAINVMLNLNGTPEGWSATLSASVLTLAADESITITMTVGIPINTTIMETTIWTVGTIEGYEYLFMWGVNVTVLSPPVASISGPSTLLTLENGSFNGTNSSDIDGTIEEYDWNFGDGTTGTGEEINHSYQEEGNYTVTLIVTDDRGLSSTSTYDVAVLNRNPIAAISIYRIVNIGIQIHGRKDNTVNMTVVEDGRPLESVSVTRVVPNPENFARYITLRVLKDSEYSLLLQYDANHSGANPLDIWMEDTDATIDTLFKTQDGFSQFDLIPIGGMITSALANDTRFYLDASLSEDLDGSITAYEWDLGDNTTSYEQTLVHNYTSGEYNLSLTVTDDDGGNSTTTTVIDDGWWNFISNPIDLLTDEGNVMILDQNNTDNQTTMVNQTQESDLTVNVTESESESQTETAITYQTHTASAETYPVQTYSPTTSFGIDLVPTIAWKKESLVTGETAVALVEVANEGTVDSGRTSISVSRSDGYEEEIIVENIQAFETIYVPFTFITEPNEYHLRATVTVLEATDVNESNNQHEASIKVNGTIRGNSIYDNTYGIVGEGNVGGLTFNDVHNNDKGIVLDAATGAVLWNDIYANTGPGIAAVEATMAIIEGNTIAGNGWAKKGELTSHNEYSPTDPNSADTDVDGYTDMQEIEGIEGYKTDPTKADTDQDGITDMQEIVGWNTYRVDNSGNSYKPHRSSNPIKDYTFDTSVNDGEKFKHL